MKKITIAICLILFIILSGCYVVYPVKGNQGKYNSQHLGSGIYSISVRENGNASEAKALSDFHKEANKICKQNGYSSYEVIEYDNSEMYNSQNQGNQGNGKGKGSNKATVYGKIRCH